MTLKTYYTKYKERKKETLDISKNQKNVKFWIRNTSDGNLKYLDNYSSISEISKTQLNEGDNLLVQDLILKNKNNHQLKLNLKINKLNPKETTILEKYLQVLQFLQRKTNKIPCIFWGTQKKATSIYHAGLKGFIPKKHKIWSLKDLRKKRSRWTVFLRSWRLKEIFPTRWDLKLGVNKIGTTTVRKRYSRYRPQRRMCWNRTIRFFLNANYEDKKEIRNRKNKFNYNKAKRILNKKITKERKTRNQTIKINSVSQSSNSHFFKKRF